MTKVLIVDDDETTRTMIRMMLRKHDVLVMEAPNASSALQLVSEQHPDVVIFDIMMPGSINGIHACELLRSHPDLANTFVVIISGRDNEADFEAAKQAGANAYFVKPFKLHRLVEVVTRHQDFADTFVLERWHF
jgi:CheY-like chemotaxis protein